MRRKVDKERLCELKKMEPLLQYRGFISDCIYKELISIQGEQSV